MSESVDSKMVDVEEDFGVDAIFEEYHEYLNKETDIKEGIRNAVKEVEHAGKEIHTLLQRIHRPGGVQMIGQLAQKARAKFENVRKHYKELVEKLGDNSYWRYNQIWNNTNGWISFLASFTVYLETEKLATRPEVCEMMGLKMEAADGFHLDIEEYLHGLCHLSNELSRFAVNSVTSDDYKRPIRIADFISSLNMGFRMLNLKNDGLRKKFDSLKYDLKKVEEVVYDLSIRGLTKKDTTEKVSETAGDESSPPQEEKTT